MTRCSIKKPDSNHQLTCPHCGRSCRRVSAKTLLHQVKCPKNQSIKAEEYYYCPAENCPAGYFSATAVIPKEALVTARQLQEGWLCYCFDISLANYQSALHSHCPESFRNFVISQTKSGNCACEVRNPSGQCCLSSFKKLDEEFTS